MKIIHAFVGALLSVVTHRIFHKSINQKISYFLMGFFRDIGRIKARRRRMEQGDGKALLLSSDLKILFKKDDPLEDVDFEMEAEDAALIKYTEQELFEFGNGENGNPILLSLFGRVFDVSKGEKYYGHDGRYGVFAGKEVTFALSTGCLEEECIAKDIQGLNEEELSEGKRWLSYFQLHDKYAHIGSLEKNEIDIDSIVFESLQSEEEPEQ